MNTLQAGLLAADKNGLALEFGVATGASLLRIAEHFPGRTHGFDWFGGLPEDWRPGFPKNRFACQPPEVPGAHLHLGMFSDTWPAWLADNDPLDISFIHIDCDLYSSTKTVLSGMHAARVRPGLVLVFDELVGYPGWQKHEHQALLEWVAAERVLLRPIAAEGEQAAYITGGSA